MKNSPTSVVSRMALTAGLGLLLGLPGLSPADDDAGKALQGVWRGARFSSGKGEDPEKGVKLELIFKNNQIHGKRLPEEQAIGTGAFKLSADGKTIDAVGTSGGFKGKTFPGIFKIEGDTLLWCTTTSGNAADRPTEFAASPAKKSYLIIVKRQKP